MIFMHRQFEQGLTRPFVRCGQPNSHGDAGTFATITQRVYPLKGR
jgi:hypothetical protein